MKSMAISKDFSNFDFSGVLYPNGTSYVQKYIDGGIGIVGTCEDEMGRVIMPSVGVCLQEVPKSISCFVSKMESLGVGSFEHFDFFAGLQANITFEEAEVNINFNDDRVFISFGSISEDMVATMKEDIKILVSSLLVEDEVICITIDKSCDGKVYEGLSNISIENLSPFTEESFDGHYALVYLI